MKKYVNIDDLLIKLMKNNIKVICLCSSHIDSDDKIHTIIKMLKSRNDQYYKIKMILSISYDDNVKLRTIKMIDIIKKVYDQDIIIIDNKTDKKCQFKHNIISIYS